MQKICVNFTFAVYNILRIVKLALPCHISNLGLQAKKGNILGLQAKSRVSILFNCPTYMKMDSSSTQTDFEYRLNHSFYDQKKPRKWLQKQKKSRQFW